MEEIHAIVDGESSNIVAGVVVEVRKSDCGEAQP